MHEVKHFNFWSILDFLWSIGSLNHTKECGHSYLQRCDFRIWKRRNERTKNRIKLRQILSIRKSTQTVVRIDSFCGLLVYDLLLNNSLCESSNTAYGYLITDYQGNTKHEQPYTVRTTWAETFRLRYFTHDWHTPLHETSLIACMLWLPHMAKKQNRYFN